MLEEIIKLSRHFLSLKNRRYVRYFLPANPLKHRCLILLGQRGIGKTTTLIQYLLQHVNNNTQDPRILYVQTDHFLLGNTTLYAIAEQFYSLGGEMIVFDEIHKYPNWSIELKSIYDTFPNLIILASGSSALEIHKGSHDLSRRAIIQRLYGLSLREYLELQCDLSCSAYDLPTIINDHENLAAQIIAQLAAKKQKILPHFKQYLQSGFYPYFLEIKDTKLYWLTLEQNVHVTIESDLAAIYPKLTGNSIKKIKQLLGFIAQSVPFTPNWKKIKTIIDIADDRTLKTYFKYLEDAYLIQAVETYSNHMKKLEASEKIYLNNPNLMYAIGAGSSNKGNLCEAFFMNMLMPHHNITLANQGDFIIDNKYTFEVGGRKKGQQQIKDLKNAYIASDDIESGIDKKIPLWLFGFLY